MKIIELMGMDSTKYGGIEKFNAALSAASSDKFVFVYNSLPRSETYIHDIESRGNKIVAIPTADKIGYIKRCLQLIKQEKPDVVHFHFDSTKYLLAPIIKLLYPKIKQIATYHSEFSTNSKTTLALAKIFNKCQSSVIAVSKGVKRGIESRLYNCQDSPRIIVSYLGVSTQEWGGAKLRDELGISPNATVFTSIGFNINIKGFDTIAESVKHIAEKSKDIDFKIMIVGLDEKVTAKFMEQLTVFKVQDYFILLGIRNDIDRVLDSTDVYLQPSRTEAISLSIMEAISHGIPVIATNVGGIPEVVIDNHNGYLITPEDSIFLSERMMQLIAAPQLAHKMGENGKDLSKQFTLKKGIDNLINIYNQL